MNTKKKKTNQKKYKEGESTRLKNEYQIIRTLKEERNKRHLTQQKLAELSGVSIDDIKKIEEGNGTSTYDVLRQLAEGLGMDLRSDYTLIKNK